jgi:hypothetical protein
VEVRFIYEGVSKTVAMQPANLTVLLATTEVRISPLLQ